MVLLSCRTFAPAASRSLCVVSAVDVRGGSSAESLAPIARMFISLKYSEIPRPGGRISVESEMQERPCIPRIRCTLKNPRRGRNSYNVVVLEYRAASEQASCPCPSTASSSIPGEGKKAPIAFLPAAVLKTNTGSLCISMAIYTHR